MPTSEFRKKQAEEKRKQRKFIIETANEPLTVAYIMHYALFEEDHSVWIDFDEVIRRYGMIAQHDRHWYDGSPREVIGYKRPEDDGIAAVRIIIRNDNSDYGRDSPRSVWVDFTTARQLIALDIVDDLFCDFHMNYIDHQPGKTWYFDEIKQRLGFHEPWEEGDEFNFCPECFSGSVTHDADADTDGCSADWATIEYTSSHCNECNHHASSSRVVRSGGW